MILDKYQVKYVSARGKEIDLTDIYVRMMKASLHKYKWTMDSTELTYGIAVDQFRKKPIEYSLEVSIIGSLERRELILEEMNNIFEEDVVNKTPGALWFNSSYIECFITEAEVKASNASGATRKTLKVYCPYPFWIQEQYVSFESSGGTVTGSKQYRYRYTYQYGQSQRLSTIIDTGHYAPSEFTLTAFGPATSLHVTIDDHPYEVDYPIYEGERMIIDSRATAPTDRRVYIIHADGSISNVFNWRSAEHSVFKKIPSGRSILAYNGGHALQLTIYKERSEPVWT